MHVRLMMIFFYFTRCIFSKARDKSDHQWFFVLLNYLTNLHLSQTCIHDLLRICNYFEINIL